MDKRLIIIPIALVMLLSACNEAATANNTATPTASPVVTITPTYRVTWTPRITRTPTPAVSATFAPTITMRPSATREMYGADVLVTQAVEPDLLHQGWLSFKSEELGVAFEYPSPTGSGTYSYSYEYIEWPKGDWDPCGTSVFWIIDPSKSSDHSWSRQPIASAVSEDYLIGRSGGPYDVIRFRRHKGEYYLDFVGDREFVVEPLHLIRHPKGVYALVYNPATISYMGWLNNLAVTLNLPEGYHPEFDAMNFLFYNDPSLDVIEKVISSVRFTH